MESGENKTPEKYLLKKSESGNFQEIVLYNGVGFVITPGIKVSVVRRSTLDNYPERCNLGR